MTVSLKDIKSPFSGEEDKEAIELAEQWLSLYERGIISAPNQVFPKDTVGRIYEKAAGYLELLSKKSSGKPYVYATDIANAFIGSYYSFTDNLRTGHYATYAHEQVELNMTGNNCTTIIPEAYLWCEALGLKPEIVQFFDFQDIRIKKDKKERLTLLS